MSDSRRVVLVGTTGLIGRCVMQAAAQQPWLHLTALARREAPVQGARCEMLVAAPDRWPEALTTVAPDGVICAIGTTMRQAESEEAFRAVDYDLVLTMAQAAQEANVRNFVLISSAGADPHSRAFYLRVKGEVEAALAKLGIRRLDILRPGLLRGRRGGDRRRLERLAILMSLLTDRFLKGARARFRSIDARVVAAAAVQFARERAQGHFIHNNQSMMGAARRLDATG